jgi:hypothetical protein
MILDRRSASEGVPYKNSTASVAAALAAAMKADSIAARAFVAVLAAETQALSA